MKVNVMTHINLLEPVVKIVSGRSPFLKHEKLPFMCKRNDKCVKMPSENMDKTHIT